MIVKESGKLRYPEKNLSEQGREPTTNSTHWYQHWVLNMGHTGLRCSQHCTTLDP